MSAATSNLLAYKNCIFFYPKFLKLLMFIMQQYNGCLDSD